MRILHTSDWHLGHTLYNYDRTEEQISMLEQIIHIVAQQKPDVFLLCGDVYHTPQPSAAVQTLLTDALVKIHQAHPAMTIIMTAGNHDSGTKHEIFRTPWRALNVYAIGNMNKERWEEHIVEIPQKGYVIAIPYTHERNLPAGFFQQILQRVAEQNTKELPVVLSAHTTVRGCDFTGHDHASEYTVGGIDSFSLEDMGEGYDYLALGHIHHEQFLHGSHRKARYSGTPLAVSFDEHYPHSVSLVEIDRAGDVPQVEKIEILNPRPLVTLPTEGFASWEKAKELLRQFPDEIPAYLRLNVEVDDFLPVEANGEAAKLVENKQCRFCYIHAKRKTVQTAEVKTLTVEEFQSEAPLDIAHRYAEDLGITFDHEMDRLFQEVVHLIDQDSRNH